MRATARRAGAVAAAAAPALALALALALAGCSSSSVGPLGGDNNNDPGHLCTPEKPGQVLSYGLTAVRNSGKVPVTIERTGLVDAHGLKWVAAWVVPSTAHFGYGVLGGYPPARSLPPGVDWAARQRARGAVLKPTTGNQRYSLVVVIKLVAPKGAAKAIGIWYSAGGSHYYLQPANSLTLKSKCI